MKTCSAGNGDACGSATTGSCAVDTVTYKCPAYSYVLDLSQPLVDFTDCQCYWGYVKTCSAGSGPACATSANGTCAFDTDPFVCPENSYQSDWPVENFTDCKCFYGYEKNGEFCNATAASGINSYTCPDNSYQSSVSKVNFTSCTCFYGYVKVGSEAAGSCGVTVKYPSGDDTGCSEARTTTLTIYEDAAVSAVTLNSVSEPSTCVYAIEVAVPNGAGLGSAHAGLVTAGASEIIADSGNNQCYQVVFGDVINQVSTSTCNSAAFSSVDYVIGRFYDVNDPYQCPTNSYGSGMPSGDVWPIIDFRGCTCAYGYSKTGSDVAGSCVVDPSTNTTTNVCANVLHSYASVWPATDISHCTCNWGRSLNSAQTACELDKKKNDGDFDSVHEFSKQLFLRQTDAKRKFDIESAAALRASAVDRSEAVHRYALWKVQHPPQLAATAKHSWKAKHAAHRSAEQAAAKKLSWLQRHATGIADKMAFWRKKTPVSHKARN